MAVFHVHRSEEFGEFRPACTTAIAGLSSGLLGTLAFQLSQINEYALAEAAYRKALERDLILRQN